MLRLLALATLAAAQIPVRFNLSPSDDMEALLEQIVPLGAQVTPPGLVIIRQETTSFSPAPGGFPLASLLQPFFAAQPEAFVVTRYDDDDAPEEHDFGCPCGEDVARLCPGAAGDDLQSVFETRLCLARARDVLSERCFEHLAEAPTVVEYCADDIAASCAGVAPGGNRVHACLAAAPRLAAPCGRYVASVGPPAGLPAPAFDDAGLFEAVRQSFSLLDSVLGTEADDAVDERLELPDVGGPWARAPDAPPAGFPRGPLSGLFRGQGPSLLRAAAPAEPYAPADEEQDMPAWEELKQDVAAREDAAEEEAVEEEVEEEEATALANLLLALCFLLLGLSTFVFSYVVAHALRKRRERAEVAAFKQRFAPLMKEAPAEV